MSSIPKANLQICALRTHSLCRKEPILDLQHAFQSSFCDHKLWFWSSSSVGGEATTTARDSKVPGTKKHPRRNLVLQCLSQDHALPTANKGALLTLVVPDLQGSPGIIPGHLWHLIAQPGDWSECFVLVFGPEDVGRRRGKVHEVSR